MTKIVVGTPYRIRILRILSATENEPQAVGAWRKNKFGFGFV